MINIDDALDKRSRELGHHKTCPMEIKKYIKSVNGYRKLVYGWDSYDADPITEKAIQRALDWLDILKDGPPDGVHPSVDGGINFYWFNGNDKHIIDIDRKGNSAYVIKDESNQSYRIIEVFDATTPIKQVSKIPDLKVQGR